MERELLQIHSAIQAQSEKEALFLCRGARNHGPLQGRARNILLQTVRGRKAHCVGPRIDRNSASSAHPPRNLDRAAVSNISDCAATQTRTREVGNFILRDPGCFNWSRSRQIEIRGRFVIGHKMGVIARSAGNQLASQARVLVHFQHVDADVRRASGDRVGRDACQLAASGAGGPQSDQY